MAAKLHCLRRNSDLSWSHAYDSEFRFYFLRRIALLRFRLAECLEEAGDHLRGDRRACARAFIPRTLDPVVLKGRTTLLASATTTPSVEPIFLATSSSRVPSRFRDMGSAPFRLVCQNSDVAGVRRLLLTLNAEERSGAIRKGIQPRRIIILPRSWRLPKAIAICVSQLHGGCLRQIQLLAWRHSPPGTKVHGSPAQAFNFGAFTASPIWACASIGCSFLFAMELH